MSFPRLSKCKLQKISRSYLETVSLPGSDAGVQLLTDQEAILLNIEYPGLSSEISQTGDGFQGTPDRAGD